MWTRLLALVRKEFRALLRDPKGRLIVIVPPLMQLVVFSFAVTFEVKNASIAVLDADGGAAAHELVQRIAGAPPFAEVVRVVSEEELRRAIDMQRVLLAVRIGPTFSRDVAAGRTARLQLVLDGRRSNASRLAGGYVSEIVAGFGAETAGLPARGPEVVARNWFNPNLLYTWFTVPSLVAVIALLAGLVLTALSVARERELGTFDQLLVSPLRTHEVLLGKAIPPLLIGLFHITLYVLAALFVFGVPLRGSLLLLYASGCFYIAAVIGVGLFLSSLAATQQQAILGAFLFMVPGTLLSGFATPIESMPGWLQPLTLANPLRHFLVIVKGIFLRGLPAPEVAVHTVPLVVIAIVTLSAAAWLFRRRTY